VHSLPELGWTPFFEALFMEHAAEGLMAGRVTFASRERYRALTWSGDLDAEPAGRLRHLAGAREELPAVGDWVALSPPQGGPAIVQAVLPRRSVLARKDAGRGSQREVVAANVDTVFLVTSLDRDLNPRRLERGLALVWDGGASPVILLTKADLVSPEEAEAGLALVERLSPAVPVHAVSALGGDGLDQLADYLRPGRTVALLGSSGVGKSTLLNRLAGHELEATGGVRASDGRGRHTTTHRHLVRLPAGGLLVDTPGVRELGLTGEEDLGKVFADVADLAKTCRFRDCRHEREPGCVVRAAIPPDRLESWRKLQREERYAAQRREHTAAYVEKRRWKRFTSR